MRSLCARLQQMLPNYAALAHSMTSGHAKAIADGKSSDATQIFLGVNKNF